MGSISLRGLDEQVKKRLKEEAGRNGVSVNSLILTYIHRAVGLNPARRIRHTDLDDLAGTWADDDMEEFMKATRHFEKIDEELWR
jgi:hypothetical protein